VSEAAPSIAAPEPGSAVELATFRDLQSRLPGLFRKFSRIRVRHGPW